MAVVTSPEEICNIALTRLGHDAISAIGEATKAGRLCAIHYAPTRDAVLRSHPWNAAIKRAALAQSSEVPTFEYGYAFALPADCLKVIRSSLEAIGYVDDYRIEGRFLLSNESARSIEYIGRILDLSLYDALLVQTMALTLSIRLCIALTDSASLLEQLRTELNEVQPTARAVDGQEGVAREVVDPTGWCQARF